MAGVPDLISALSSALSAVRDAAAASLARITNHDETTLSSSKSEGTLVERWKRWLAAHRRWRRAKWVLDGFRRAHYELDKKLRRSIPELIRAVGDKAHLSYNAQRLLMRVTNHHPRSLEWSRFDAQYYWNHWYTKRRRRFR